MSCETHPLKKKLGVKSHLLLKVEVLFTYYLVTQYKRKKTIDLRRVKRKNNNNNVSKIFPRDLKTTERKQDMAYPYVYRMVMVL